MIWAPPSGPRRDVPGPRSMRSAVRSWSREAVVAEARRAGFDGVEWEVGATAHIPLPALTDAAAASFKLSAEAGLASPCLSAEAAVPVLDARSRGGVVYDPVNMLVEGN